MIKFSIREMLALACLVALAMLMWRTREESLRSAERLEEIRGQVAILEDQTFIKRPVVHQAMLRTRDEFNSLGELAQRSIEHLDVLRQKYSEIKTTDPTALSIRGVPALQVGSNSPPLTYRILVPADRPVWLKYGVHLTQPRVNRSEMDDAQLLMESPVADTGPFQMRLKPGIHFVSIQTQPTVAAAKPISLTVDGQIALKTLYAHKDVSGVSTISISGLQQIDFPTSRPLPWLATLRVSLRPGNTGPSKKIHGIALWLSDRSSEFKAFPNQ